MRVGAEVKITILEGEERGKVHTFSTVGDTESLCTKSGIIEQLKLEWNYFTPYKMSEIPTGSEGSIYDKGKRLYEVTNRE